MNATTGNPTTITAQPGTPFLEVVREFDAPRDLVFRAVTEAEYVVQWLGPRSISMRIETWDARTGGSYGYVHSRDDFEARFRGVFHSIVPDELVIQTFEFDGAPNEVALETMRLADLGGRTRLTTRSVFPSVEARDMAVASGMNEGVRESMDRLAELVAR